ncbi:hypothetical protein DAEQUDRAFT_728899 [Daedalea quercina L-15889]|uniref:Poly A polymerase head domain-containing protein n=1 Tax=Daedalea quercina L-15889 TaxID=1314783 RepID=A0A165P1U8_9APHY|nr:hypothetical protein DAEQUDRAFT_728899 [Daedalea quercina L-15889]
MMIELTKEEDELCTLLDECTKHIKETEGLEVECRIAGGWVRDKILRISSHDIDVALSNMMGVTFATFFVDYCTNVKGLEVGRVARIESNPEQSKHLETARTTVLGRELDFVNLRSEEYAQNSRIPTRITFGTPLQDAMRRDITINALFYNVHTRAIEDHTGMGLDDMKNRIIRTPLSPMETFTDDPLRVLRAIRFASRYGFELSPPVRNAARNRDIQKALATKVSKERIGVEVEKMMQACDPLRAVTRIQELQLYSTVFQVSEQVAKTLSGPPAPSWRACGTAAILYTLCRHDPPPNLPRLHPALASFDKERRAALARLYLACALTPYQGITCKDVKKKKIHPASEMVLREGLKLGVQNHYLDGIPALFDACGFVSPRVTELAQGESPGDRREIGLFLHNPIVHKPPVITWELSLLFSLVQDLLADWSPETDVLDDIKASERIAQYNRLVTKIEELGLAALLDGKPLLDGNDLTGALAAKPGPWVRIAMNRVLEWRLSHPEGTKEECLEWVKGEHAAGNIVINAPGKRAQDQDTEQTEAAKKTKR